MDRRNLIVLTVASLALALSALPQKCLAQSAEQQIIPLKRFPADIRFETVSGDPTKPGAPFVIRIHAEAGYVIMPHTHTIDENIVVITGTWALGMGDRFRRDSLQLMEPGTYGFVPKNMKHFGLSKTETILQVHGLGPFTTRWVTPIYELTDKGFLLGTSAAEPGRSAPTAPPGCFNLKLGAHVHGSDGEGVIIGAQCTPGQLTQYRIKKSNGDRFWAQRDELHTR